MKISQDLKRISSFVFAFYKTGPLFPLNERPFIFYLSYLFFFALLRERDRFFCYYYYLIFFSHSLISNNIVYSFSSMYSFI
ncbi:unnamed protein product [Rhizophagus irregularis]|uniref:Uncharacterized protein n=2 Tax=Rhizophagus irregularis TaxID=588596 RepID=A0A915ZJE7_9GLOM|nr:hypothetical protein GLOIN_2v1662521 [Rhizophagus irregularis DAOM 181602=DAOM 197198]CAB4489833.1 unnamed protein product [Rhizophagus irregularis]POG65879.1 hypothetical protein GLOIN_2v1662521 [Rhizophagus irregularis DAOM 181602=DAOM 197198]CAB5204453.1 unnamed protein product [Rhizophagus irregularis]CAB5377402.1 unnamed protein product [Rhizophagus irregularis]GBC39489.1 hypothetical protein GLOIN_2v1662521 [Rhizophagus irregularis DAOM 181602=DAOM 197198]|eukprot:XP_025172745.1 hypothetical protein GLOIN_2v1662521 [Rhizophagus irregularis DAOM 181602=DAOM 197198]